MFSSAAGQPFGLQDVWPLIPVLILVAGGFLMAGATWWSARKR